MSATVNFSGVESLNTPAQVTLTDTSVGDLSAITSRRISFKLADQTYLSPGGAISTSITYTTWDILTSYITISNLLPNSLSVWVTVDWLTGTSVIYSKTILFDWNWFDYIFALNQLSNQTSSPQILQDADYYNSFITFIVNMFNSENATIADDQYSAQASLDKNLYMIENEDDFF